MSLKQFVKSPFLPIPIVRVKKVWQWFWIFEYVKLSLLKFFKIIQNPYIQQITRINHSKITYNKVLNASQSQTSHACILMPKCYNKDSKIERRSQSSQKKLKQLQFVSRSIYMIKLKKFLTATMCQSTLVST